MIVIQELNHTGEVSDGVFSLVDINIVRNIYLGAMKWIIH